MFIHTVCTTSYEILKYTQFPTDIYCAVYDTHIINMLHMINVHYIVVKYLSRI